jgi:hypothetical protein
MILSIPVDLLETSADAIWPRLPSFDQHDMSRRCRELGLALQLHPDRGELMHHGTPQQVRSYLMRLVDELDILTVVPGCIWKSILGFPGLTFRRYLKSPCNCTKGKTPGILLAQLSKPILNLALFYWSAEFRINGLKIKIPLIS